MVRPWRLIPQYVQQVDEPRRLEASASLGVNVPYTSGGHAEQETPRRDIDLTLSNAPRRLRATNYTARFDFFANYARIGLDNAVHLTSSKPPNVSNFTLTGPRRRGRTTDHLTHLRFVLQLRARVGSTGCVLPHIHPHLGVRDHRSNRLSSVTDGTPPGVLQHKPEACGDRGEGRPSCVDESPE